MDGMKEDSSEKSTTARSTGDIIIQKDGRLLRAECVCRSECVFCVFTFIPYCVEMRKREGKRVRHWENEKAYMTLACVCVLGMNL